MQRLLPLALAASLVAASFAPMALMPAVAAPGAVQADDYFFAPGDQSITVGDTVTWTNVGSEGHTVTSDDNSWGTDDLEPGASYAHTFAVAGTYHYVCVIHDGMEGTITVR